MTVKKFIKHYDVASSLQCIFFSNYSDKKVKYKFRHQGEMITTCNFIISSFKESSTNYFNELCWYIAQI